MSGRQVKGNWNGKKALPTYTDVPLTNAKYLMIKWVFKSSILAYWLPHLKQNICSGSQLKKGASVLPFLLFVSLTSFDFDLDFTFDFLFEFIFLNTACFGEFNKSTYVELQTAVFKSRHPIHLPETFKLQFFCNATSLQKTSSL